MPSGPKPLKRIPPKSKQEPSVSFQQGNQPSFNEFANAFIIIPPDGGWGWVVVFGSFFGNFIADGVMYTFGLFLKEISVSLHTTTTNVAYANSFMTGVYYLAGPVVSALTNRFGFRCVAIIGGVLSAIAFIISSFLNSLPLFICAYGILGGFGFSMVYIPAVIVVGFYFERWRAIATAVAVSGSAAGIIVFPLIMEHWLNHYNWRLKFRILAGGCLTAGMLGTLYRPLMPIRIVPADDTKSLQFGINSVSTYVVQEEKRGCCYMCKQFHNKRYPTTADIRGNSIIAVLEPGQSHPSHTNISRLSSFIADTKDGTRTVSSYYNRPLELSTVYEYEDTGRKKCKRIIRKCFCCFCKQRFKLHGSRPMYRDDIFYGGSLMTIPAYSMSIISVQASQFNAPAIDYHMSVSRVATQKDLEDEYVCCVCCTESIIRPLATMLDMSLLKSPTFLLLALSGSLTVLGLYTPFVYITERAIRGGMETDKANMLLSVLGIANFVGRIVSGILSTLPNIKALLITIIHLYIAGISTMLSFFSFNDSAQLAYCIIFGGTIACLSSIRTIIIVDLLGLEKLTNAFGILMTFQGISCLIGLPVSGFLFDLTQDYIACFLFAGAAITLSSTLLLPLKAVSNWEQRKAKT